MTGPHAGEFDLDASEALEQIDDLIARAEELPDRAASFRDGVLETLRSMKLWIEDNEQVTEKQQDALDNIEGGIERWEHGR